MTNRETAPGYDLITSNTLIVDKQADNTIASRGTYNAFKYIQSAINAALPGDVILISPGIYDENLTLRSAITILGYDRLAAIINGNVSWTPTVSSMLLIYDIVDDIYSDITQLKHLSITGTLTFDGSKKTDSITTVLSLDDVTVPVVNKIGNDIQAQTAISMWRCGATDDGGAPTVTIISGQNAIFNAVYSGINIINASAGTIELDRSEVLQDVNVSNGFFSVNDTHFYGNVSLTNLTTPDGRRCFIDGNLVVNSSDFDFLKSRIDGTVTGSGTVNRDKITGSKVTVMGDNDIVISPPLFDTNYQVRLTEIGNTPAGVMPSIKTKAVNKVTINDSVGGRTFDWIIEHG